MSYLFHDILHDVSRSRVIDNGDLHAANSLILSSAIKGLGISRASIWRLSPDKQNICCQLLVDHQSSAHTSPSNLSRAYYPIYFNALDQARAIVANAAMATEAIQELAEPYLQPLGITALIDAPIRHRGEITGIICCESREGVRQWREDEIAFVGTLADLYGRAISAEQRNNYELQLHQINEQLEAKVKERTDWLENALRNLTHTQAKLIESEKLASVGRMVSGLAHEINTPLGIAVTSASHCGSELKRLQQLYDEGKLAEEDFEQFLLALTEGMDLVSNNLNRAAMLVQNFKLTGSIQTSSEEENFELRNCIDLIVKSLQPLLKQHQLTCHFASDQPIILNSYPGALAQIITNLVTNSIHHGFNNIEQGAIQIHIARHNDHVHLTYRDNGNGIAESIQDKVFEPFFTTARKTGGSGLGLSIVYNLVTQKLKGRVNIESKTGEGATFLITFPVSVS